LRCPAAYVSDVVSTALVSPACQMAALATPHVAPPMYAPMAHQAVPATMPTPAPASAPQPLKSSHVSLVNGCASTLPPVPPIIMPTSAPTKSAASSTKWPLGSV